MAEITVQTYTQDGKLGNKLALPEGIFALKNNADLVHQVVTGMLANKRAGTAHAKFRGEVSGGGKKPWRQKGTGRARHGSTRSPIWIGGGTTHGPRSEKDYSVKINSKMRAKALATALSSKLKGGKIMFVESLRLPAIKTETASEIMKSLKKIKGFERLGGGDKDTFVVTPKNDTTIKKSFRNLKGVAYGTVSDMNVVDVLNHKFVVITDPENAIEILKNKVKA